MNFRCARWGGAKKPGTSSYQSAISPWSCIELKASHSLWWSNVRKKTTSNVSAVTRSTCNSRPKSSNKPKPPSRATSTKKSHLMKNPTKLNFKSSFKNHYKSKRKGATNASTCFGCIASRVTWKWPSTYAQDTVKFSWKKWRCSMNGSIQAGTIGISSIGFMTKIRQLLSRSLKAPHGWISSKIP